MNVKDKNFKTRWGFVLACVGSAVGMANVWGFPFRMASLGGAAFLIPYLIFVALFSYVGLSAEYAIGRKTGTGTLGSYEYAWKSRGFKGVSKVIGWIPLIGSFCIAIGYSVIVAYVLKALVESLTGTLMTVDSQSWFEGFSLTAYSVVPYHIAIIIAVAITLSVGAKSIEKTSKIMMPLFFVLFLILAVRVFFLDNSFKGYEFMFTPRFDELANPEVWIYAMGQAFFSLSVTGSGMIVYGSYLSKGEDIVKSAKETAFFDTIAALTAALVIVPSTFAYGVDLNSGPGLLFVTLPTILQDIAFGRVFAIILFLAVVFGGITSLQNMIEVVVESLLYKFPKLKRNTVLTVLIVLLFAISVNMHQIFKWGPWMDFVSIYIIPIGAVIGSITWFWVLKKDELLDEVNDGAEKQYSNTWHVIGKYVYVPLATILCAIALFKGISF
ncbi:MAG: sodium-dependent transporter [Peptoniphilus sp.]|nr:sodium-dependent transporter [Peptoniphilus sp.]